MKSNARTVFASCLLLSGALGAGPPAMAKGGAHLHGLVRIDVAVSANTLTVHIEAPLDSLLGFEHRPRSPTQREAGVALLKRMTDDALLVRPDPAAQCARATTTVESAALQLPAAKGASKDEHADLNAGYEFTCQQADKLTAIDIGLFDTFKRIQKIEVQVAGPKGQWKQTLQRPNRVLKLIR